MLAQNNSLYSVAYAKTILYVKQHLLGEFDAKYSTLRDNLPRDLHILMAFDHA